MRVLVLGAGAVGGYFGARIHEAGGDVSFLVRPARAAQLRAHGLRVSSPHGDLQIEPKLVTHEDIAGTYDLIIIACKAYDLDSAMDAIAPAIGANSFIVPILNGVRHIGVLEARFGRGKVLGGVARISSTLGANGEILHLNRLHEMIVGALDGKTPPLLEELARLCAPAKLDLILAADIEQSLWDKVVFLATAAGGTCLMRASVGTILATLEGKAYLNGLFDETTAIAAAHGHRVSDAQLNALRGILNDRDSALVASMMRDVEGGRPTEGEHILGDLVARAEQGKVEVPRLRLAYSHLQAYELRRAAG